MRARLPSSASSPSRRWPGTSRKRSMKGSSCRRLRKRPPTGSCTTGSSRLPTRSYQRTRKQLAHLTVGRLLRERWDPGTTGQRLFDIAQHLNLGRSLITSEAERLALARLDLAAGRKAKSATAFQVALGYFSAGLTMLCENHWSTEYELAFALHLEAAECEYLCGSFEEAERDFDRLLTKARTKLDKAKIYSLKILQYEHTSRYADAIRSGLEALALFGLSFPGLPEETQAARDAARCRLKHLQ